MVAATRAASAGEINWVGGLFDHEGAWEQPDNWDAGVVPTTSDDVTISDGLSAKIIDPQSVATLQLQGGLGIDPNGMLTVGSGITVTGSGSLHNDGEVDADITTDNGVANTYLFTGNLQNNGGSATNAVNLDIGGTEAIWTGDVLGNNGTIVNYDGAEWIGGVKAQTYDGQIQNFGTWTDGTITSNDGMIFNIDGSWTGDITGNSNFIDNNTDDGTTNVGGGNLAEWFGDIYGNDAVIRNENLGTWTGAVQGNAGTVTNSAGGTWTGGVTGNTGFITNLGAWGGTISGNGVSGGPVETTSSYIENGATGVWTGDISGNYGLIKNMAGTWNGNVLGNGLGNGAGGTISNDTLGIWNGQVRGNGGRIDNNHIWTGAVTGNAGGINNRGQWIGAVSAADIDNGDTGNTGTITNYTVGTWTGDVLGNSGTITNYGKWIGSFTNAGTVNARNSITGAFSNSGLLHLTGTLTGISTLTNAGVLDMRGTSVGQTLTAASASFGSGSTYEVSIDSAGHADRLIAGAATLGGAVLVTAKPTGSYGASTPYTIVSADSLSGTFASVSTDLTFLTPRLTYNATEVVLTMVRNDVGFSTAGTTGNQVAVAATIEELGTGSALYDAVLWLTQPQAQLAFDALSGEIHASAKSQALDNSALVRDLAFDRLRQIFDEPEPVAATGYAGPADVAGTPGPGTGFWTQFYGAFGVVAAGPGTSALVASSGGIAIGLDGAATDWNVGLMLHAGLSATTASALDSRIGSEDFGAGVYAGRSWGDTRLALGADYTRHNLHSSRSVAFEGFSDALSADYAASTTQAFAELSHEFHLGALSLLPYASLAAVSHATDRMIETGGAAALSGGGGIVDASFTTLGVRAEQKAVVGDDMLLTLAGTLGWRHAFAEPVAGTYRLADGSDFDVVGAPIAGDVLVLNAGINLDVSVTTQLGLTYAGQLGGNAQSHALKAIWAGRF